MGSQVSGENRSRFPGRGTVGEVRRGGRKASDRTKKRVYSLRVRFRREKRARRLPCLSLGNDRESTSRSGDVSLAIFITFVSGSESLTSSISADHQALGWRLIWPKGMEDLAAFGVRDVKRAAAEEKKRVFLCRRTVRFKL